VTRVYVPSTLGRLRGIVLADGVGPAPFAAHAVTEAVREAWPDGGDEEWEHAAATAAAQSAVALLTEHDAPRRVVVAVDVPSARPADADDPTLVEVDDVVPFRRVAGALVDSADAEQDVAAARDAVAADPASAEAAVERLLDHEPGWWAASELGGLLAETGEA